ncbi:beta-ketoacyl-ACP synthase II [Myxococcota bacterium]|nr:beta-ketoacyl-ACP synthase II [Myxococcota bacterium]
MRRRVVVTGVGAVSPVGATAEQTWAGLLAGRSGVDTLSCFDATGFGTTIAGEVRDFDPSAWLDHKEVKKFDRFIQFAVAASRMALRDSGLVIDESNADRVGVYIGSGIGGVITITESDRTRIEKGPDRVSPFTIPKLLVNMAPGYVSILVGARGPNVSHVSACATGSHSIGEAADAIRAGRADVVLAGGAEAPLTPIAFAGFGKMKALSERNSEPERASRPFDAGRDGFVMGEGAGVLVIEELEHARRRGARILAELAGYGANADAHHITAPAPGGRGAARCMRLTLADAGVAPEEVGYVNAHGTSTPYNDSAETAAIKEVFGDHARRLAVSSTKSMTGHLLGAAGGLEAVISVLALHRGVLPPTINLEVPDPECDLDYVPGTAREQRVRAVMSNAFGFGGTNACLLFRAFA